MRNKILGTLAIVIVGMLLMLGCAPTVAPEESGGPLIIGYIGNMAWPVAADAFYAVQLAADEINQSGGIMGRPVEVVQKDSRGEAPLAVAAYKELVMTNGAEAVILAEGAELNFACQGTGAELFPEYPHLCFNPTTSHEGLGLNVLNEYDKYKFYFRTWIDTDQYRASIFDAARNLKRLAGAKTVALVTEDAQWTEYFRHGKPGEYAPVEDDMKKETGVDVVYTAEIALGEKMFLPLFQVIAAKSPDWIMYVSAYSDVTTFTKQWSESAAKNIDLWDGGGASSMAGFWGMTGGAALGLLTPTYSRAALSEKTIPFIEALKERYGKDTSWISFDSYDSVYLIKAAAEKAKTTEVEALIKALESIEMTGVCGKLVYGDTHTCKYGWPYLDFPYGQFQKDGELVILYPEEVAKATNPGQTFIPVRELRKGS